MGFVNLIFISLLSLQGVYNLADQRLLIFRLEYKEVQNKMQELCNGQTETTIIGGENAVAIGFRYINEGCYEISAVKTTLDNKIHRLEQWMEMEPEQQFLRKSIVLNE